MGCGIRGQDLTLRKVLGRRPLNQIFLSKRPELMSIINDDLRPKLERYLTWPGASRPESGNAFL